MLLADGTTKPIEEVEPGDTVQATDPQTGETVSRQVTHTIRTDDDKPFVDVTVDGTTARGHHHGDRAPPVLVGDPPDVGGRG